jgi:hypothetical protein
MKLDINTPRGQIFVDAEMLAMGILKEALGPEYRLEHTDITSAHPIDVFVYHADEVVAVLEMKSRREEMDQFESWGSYLINTEKMDQISHYAKKHNAAGYVSVYSMVDGTLRAAKVCDSEGLPTGKFPSELRWTSATCNGGRRQFLVTLIPWGLFGEPSSL